MLNATVRSAKLEMNSFKCKLLLGSCTFSGLLLRCECSLPRGPQATSGATSKLDHASLLTAALREEVQLQGCYVSVPAQSVDMVRVWGPVEEIKGFLVGLGGAEPRQVAA